MQVTNYHRLVALANFGMDPMDLPDVEPITSIGLPAFILDDEPAPPTLRTGMDPNSAQVPAAP
jgi:hypothetical protein